MTSVPSQAIWRDVPKRTLLVTAKQSQATAERSVVDCRARRQPYRQRMMAKIPAISLMNVTESMR